MNVHVSSANLVIPAEECILETGKAEIGDFWSFPESLHLSVNIHFVTIV